MKNISYDVLTPYISDVFKKTELTQKPIVAVHSRDQRKTLNLIKTFYLKYPQYRWVTFRDMRGLSESEFASTLKDCCLSIWIDDTSGFGTFPLESMKCGVPCVGKIPNLFPSWMSEDNGLWLAEETKICDFAADFIQNWLEDTISPTLYEDMEKTANEYTSKDNFEAKVVELFSNYIEVRTTQFEDQYNRLKPDTIDIEQ
jgi:glycosyltransferase involved in cell wall biosynthesis